MKKTITTLLALAGVVVGAEASPFASVYVISEDAHTQGGNPSALMVSSDGETALSTAVLWAHGGAVTFDQDENAITTSGTGTLQYLNKSQAGIELSTLSYTFDASWTKNENGPSYFTSVGEDSLYNTYSFRIGIDENSNWTITTSGYDAITLTHQTAASASGSSSYLVTSSLTDGVYTLSLYENNTLIVQGQGEYGFGQPGNFKIAFGGCFGTTDNAMAGTFSDISLYNAIIPEPATATLSLLALAGLAARRRRK